jgi:hypothetical protein
LVVTAQPPAGVVVGKPFDVQVSAEDANGNVDPNFAGSVSIALDNNPGGSTLGGTLTVNAVNGVADFFGLTLDKAGAGYTLQAVSAGLDPVTTDPFDVTDQLVVTTQPPNQALPNAEFFVAVSAEDAHGSVDTNFSGPVTIDLDNNPGQATLGGTVTVDAVNGVALFSDLSVDKSGLGYTLQATSGDSGPATTTPFNVIGYTPAEIRAAYGIDKLPLDAAGKTLDGTGQTIAIVAAYNDPNIFQDLNTFDQTFQETSETLYQQYGPASSFLTVYDENGQVINPLATAVPVDPTGGWEAEEAQDVEWVHAVAPGAKIALVECNSPSHLDNPGAVTAAGLPGLSVVSMSFGGPEQNSETQEDSLFTSPGVTYLASSGDSGVPGGYPAFSPNVVAVGGTSLYLDAFSSYNSEAGWNGSGGGISQIEPEPSYQEGVQSTGNRTIPDVPFDADPATPAVIADSYNNGFGNPWDIGDGTSLGAPSWAGLIAIVNQGRAAAGKAALDSSSPTYALGALYSLSGNDFHDNLGGANGASTSGLKNPSRFDEVTGLGTPVANLLVPDLINFAAPTTAMVVSSVNPSVHGQVLTFTATVTSQIPGTGTPTGAVQFQVDGQSLGSPVFVNGGKATSLGIALATGSHTVTVSYVNSDGNFVDSSASLAGDQQVNALTAANLQQVLSPSSPVTIDVSTNTDAQNAISAVNQLPSYSSTPVTVTIDLAPGSYTDLAAAPAPGVTLVINGNGTTTTIVGQSPA